MQSVTSRTAGFTSIDITQLNDSSTLIVILLMFIGGGSLSTASGIKIGTFIVLLAAVYSYVFHRKEVVRSEEHTSELQSLMRSSYAVFCLKKKKTTTNT